MPDRIRHPRQPFGGQAEHPEIAGFRLLGRVQDRLRRNDAFEEFQAFYEFMKTGELYLWVGRYLFLLQPFPAVTIGMVIDIQKLGGFTFIAFGHF